MSNDLKILLGLIATAFLALIAIGNLSLPMDLHTYRLTLTNDGCAYAQSINLQVEKTNGLCSAQARFWPNAIGGGGAIHLDNDKKITLTESMLLATEKLEIVLPPTPAQRKGWIWFFGWMVAALIVAAATFYTWFAGVKVKKMKS